MRPIRIAALALGAGIVLFLAWKAVLYFPDAWTRFRGRTRVPVRAVRIDSTLFEADEPAAESDSTPHRPLDSLLLARRDSLGVRTLRISTVRPTGEPIPLYSLELRRGIPLAQRVLVLSELLRSRGWRLSESDERPAKATWSWTARIERGDSLSGLLRARVSADPANGTFGLRVAFWTRDTGRIPSLKGLPPGCLVALPPRAWSDSSLGSRLRAAGAVPALLVDLETTREPVSLQAGRILLQHREPELRKLVLRADSCRTAPLGIVVVDGDRGSADPQLARRLADFARGFGWWILDATGDPSSRLGEKAREEGAPLAAPAARRDMAPAAALAAAQIQAEAEGESSVVLPLDSAVVRKVAACLPLMQRTGVAVVPWPVSRRSAKE